MAAAAAYARLVEAQGSGPNDWEVCPPAVCAPSTAAAGFAALGTRRKGAIISVEHAREGLWLKLAGEDDGCSRTGGVGAGMLRGRGDGPATTPAPGARVLPSTPRSRPSRRARRRRGRRRRPAGADCNQRTAEARVVDSAT